MRGIKRDVSFDLRPETCDLRLYTARNWELYYCLNHRVLSTCRTRFE